MNSQSEGFSKEERLAMKERAKELKAASLKADGLNEVLAKIAEMPQPDRGIGERLHAVITTSAPELEPRLWYGQPAYSIDGKVLCFFQSAEKFSTRYATLGFSDQANLDDGGMWPSSYAVSTLSAADEEKIAALVKKAASGR